MWKQMDGLDRFGLIVGIFLVLRAIAVLIVMLTFDLSQDVFSGLSILFVVWGMSGPVWLYLACKETFMKIGIVERIMERRRIAAAAELAERYRGMDLMSSPEAVALPVPVYRCSGCGSAYVRNTADRMYWVDEQPLLSAGWHCEDCVDKLQDKPRYERLNMEIFLIMLDGDLGADKPACS